MMIGNICCLWLCVVNGVYGSLTEEKTFYEVANIDQYDNYGDISLFEHMVPDTAILVRWHFETGTTNQKCPVRNVTVFLQHGSYPLPYATNNKTYPADFFLHRTDLHEVKLNTTGNITTLDIAAPTAGRWFGAAFVNYKENNDVIKQITDLDCRYYILVNVTTSYQLNIPQLVDSIPTQIGLANTQDYRLYRFYVEENVWQYKVKLTHCGGSAKRAGCSLQVSVQAGAIPNNSSQTTNCDSTTNAACTMEVVSPTVTRWHYLLIEATEDVAVNATLTIVMHGCTMHLDQTTEQNSSELKTQKEVTNITMETVDMVTATYLYTTDTYDTSTTADTNPNVTNPPNHVTCGPVSNLYRTEDMKTPDYAVYSLGPQSVDEVLIVSPHQVSLVQFDVVPIKDSGGTLLYSAKLSQVAINPNHTQNVTVKMCLSPFRIPANSTQYSCPPDSAVEMSLDTESQDNLTASRHLPYPEPGPYFIGFQSYCYVLGNSTLGSGLVKIYEPCAENYSQVVFEIKNGPCVNVTCAGHGECRTYGKGAYIYSSCYCYANYMGYTCEDDSHTMSLSLQMLYTCLLSLSNLFFIPAIAVATWRRYYVEAFVYFANMFFSGFYHACDMHPWSIYTLCIMPYHTLSYCDFFLSILSFWVTLLAMCELPEKILSVLHMLGAVGLSMGVEWAQHTLLIYVVPIVVGLILIIVMWVLRSVKKHRCYPGKNNSLFMLPGFLLAVVGLVIYAFLQDDVNYPYTHSAWHVCIATSIVFLLPRRRLPSCISKDKDVSSDEFEFDNRSENDLLSGDHGDHGDHSLLINGARLRFAGPQPVVHGPDLVI